MPKLEITKEAIELRQRQIKNSSQKKIKEAFADDPRHAKREQVKGDVSSDECLDFWHRYKDQLRTGGVSGVMLGIDEGVIKENDSGADTVYDWKRCVKLSRIAKVMSRTMYIVKDREEKGQTVSLQEEARILDWQYEKVLDDESSMY